MIARARTGGCRAPYYRRAVFGVLLILSVSVVGPIGIARADQSVQPMTAGYQNGTITAIYQQTFEIDRRVYSLTPDAVLLDDSGNQLDAGALVVTAEVKYHVKKEQIDKIDRMIVILPR